MADGSKNIGYRRIRDHTTSEVVSIYKSIVKGKGFIVLNVNPSYLKLSLQPIIENSIQYGLEAKDKLKLKVRARLSDRVLRITILDDGPGISEPLSSLRRYRPAKQAYPRPSRAFWPVSS
ncbi:sensor histidine kinase [Cohnella sp. GCM10020058]|uniref:sensor histidine kinase n=1 Tax=Cohnella sp. GCM10020058 TaxID=3317330 RepID=UPI003642831D